MNPTQLKCPKSDPGPTLVNMTGAATSLKQETGLEATCKTVTEDYLNYAQGVSSSFVFYVDKIESSCFFNIIRILS